MPWKHAPGAHTNAPAAADARRKEFFLLRETGSHYTSDWIRFVVPLRYRTSYPLGTNNWHLLH
jgi:hypothetical protein